MNKKQPNIIILGAGESGIGAALLAQQQGAKVFVSDRGQISDRYRSELEEAGIEYESGQHSEERVLAADEVIKSPGIPERVPLIQQLLKQGTPVIGEIEYAARFTDATMVAITGSNGKTTTSYLTHQLLQAAGLKSHLVGNVGYSFARSIAQQDKPQVYVIEVSSFQLDSIEHFRPQLAAVLNITPDHLDRYNHEMSGYIASKMRVTRNQQAEDGFWFLAEDDNSQTGLQEHPTKAETFPLSKAAVKGHGFVLDGAYIDLETTKLRGKHNALNALFAASFALRLGANTQQIQAGLNDFEPVPHRLEPVGEANGVQYINDSKATNVDAVTYALGAMTRPVIWVAGGTDKGNDYTPLAELVQSKVKALVCLGVDNTKLKAAFGGQLEKIVETDSAAGAVQAAARLAEPGDVVLLSPACASFDLFNNYIDRGDQFRAAVKKM